MFTSLFWQPDTRAGLSEIDWMLDATSATSVYQYTLSGLGRSQQTQVAVPEGRLIIERESEEPAWFPAILRVVGELLNLPENWDSYGARRINPAAVAFALQLLSDTMRPETPAPAVVPTSGGSIQLEWHTRGIDLEIEIKSPGRLYVSYEDHRHGVEWEGELTSDLTRLSDFIVEFSRHGR